MLLFSKKVEDNALLAMWKIEESVEDLLEILHNDAKIVGQVNQFGSEKRRLEFLAVRVLLANVLNADKPIAYHASGDPYLEDNSYYISIAHTGPFVAIILHPDRLVGVDVERLGDKVARVKHKFLSESERSAVVADNEKVHLTLLWAVKESLYKVMKKEVVDFVADMQVVPFVPYLEGVIGADETRSEQQLHYQLHYEVYPEFVCVWTVQGA